MNHDHGRMPGQAPDPDDLRKSMPPVRRTHRDLFHGFTVYNDTLSCVQWCKYARKCVGDEMYEHMMEIAAAQKARAAEERAAKQGGTKK